MLQSNAVHLWICQIRDNDLYFFQRLHQWISSSSSLLMIIFFLMFLHYFLTILILFKNCFNKFISSIFISKNNYWLSKFIINTNKFVSKTTRNVVLMFFWVKPFIAFNILQIRLKISMNFKWNWYLFEIILKFNCSFF